MILKYQNWNYIVVFKYNGTIWLHRDLPKIDNLLFFQNVKYFKLKIDIKHVNRKTLIHLEELHK